DHVGGTGHAVRDLVGAVPGAVTADHQAFHASPVFFLRVGLLPVFFGTDVRNALDPPAQLAPGHDHFVAKIGNEVARLARRDADGHVDDFIGDRDAGFVRRLRAAVFQDHVHAELPAAITLRPVV